MDYSVLLLITNVCNLNCAGCSVLCSKNQINQWFISKEDFTNTLLRMKQIFPNLGTLDLSGGESLLHPDFWELCSIAKEIFPEAQIKLWTNGILLKKFSQEELEILFKKYNVHFQISLYPSMIDHISTFEKQNIQFQQHLSILSRFFFYRPTSNSKGDMDMYLKYKTCQYFKTPFQFYIYKNRIYNCCIGPHIIENIMPNEDFNQFSVDINDNKISTDNDLLKFFNKPLKMCKYCGNKTIREESVPWAANVDNHFDLQISFKDLYLYNYDKYKKIYNDQKINTYLKNSLKNSYFIQHLQNDNKYRDEIFQHYENRFFGTLDFIILFDDTNIMDKIRKLCTLLNTNNFNIKINFYFISIKKLNQINEDKLYEMFYPFSNSHYSYWFYKINNQHEFINFITNECYGLKKCIVKI